MHNQLPWLPLVIVFAGAVVAVAAAVAVVAVVVAAEEGACSSVERATAWH